MNGVMHSGSWKSCSVTIALGLCDSGWAGLFSGGIAAQIITRYSNLTDVIWNNKSKEILNNRIVP